MRPLDLIVVRRLVAFRRDHYRAEAELLGRAEHLGLPRSDAGALAAVARVDAMDELDLDLERIVDVDPPAAPVPHGSAVARELIAARRAMYAAAAASTTEGAVGLDAEAGDDLRRALAAKDEALDELEGDLCHLEQPSG